MFLLSNVLFVGKFGERQVQKLEVQETGGSTGGMGRRAVGDEKIRVRLEGDGAPGLPSCARMLLEHEMPEARVAALEGQAPSAHRGSGPSDLARACQCAYLQTRIYAAADARARSICVLMRQLARRTAQL